MAETLNLRFRVVNAGIAEREVEIDHDGEPAILKQRILHIDAEPLDGTVRTLELELPARAYEGKIVAGTMLNASIAFEPPSDVAEEAGMQSPEAEG